MLGLRHWLVEPKCCALPTLSQHNARDTVIPLRRSCKALRESFSMGDYALLRHCMNTEAIARSPVQMLLGTAGKRLLSIPPTCHKRIFNKHSSYPYGLDRRLMHTKVVCLQVAEKPLVSIRQHHQSSQLPVTLVESIQVKFVR